MAVTTVTLSLTLSRAPRCGDNVSEPESPWSPQVRRDLHQQGGKRHQRPQPRQGQPCTEGGFNLPFHNSVQLLLFQFKLLYPSVPLCAQPWGDRPLLLSQDNLSKAQTPPPWRGKNASSRDTLLGVSPPPPATGHHLLLGQGFPSFDTLGVNQR